MDTIPLTYLPKLDFSSSQHSSSFVMFVKCHQLRRLRHVGFGCGVFFFLCNTVDGGTVHLLQMRTKHEAEVKQCA